jgi:predicted RNA-binding protein (virulence factor B family)
MDDRRDSRYVGLIHQTNGHLPARIGQEAAVAVAAEAEDGHLA